MGERDIALSPRPSDRRPYIYPNYAHRVEGDTRYEQLPTTTHQSLAAMKRAGPLPRHTQVVMNSSPPLWTAPSRKKKKTLRPSCPGHVQTVARKLVDNLTQPLTRGLPDLRPPSEPAVST